MHSFNSDSPFQSISFLTHKRRMYQKFLSTVVYAHRQTKYFVNGIWTGKAIYLLSFCCTTHHGTRWLRWLVVLGTAPGFFTTATSGVGPSWWVSFPFRRFLKGEGQGNGNRLVLRIKTKRMGEKHKGPQRLLTMVSSFPFLRAHPRNI